MAVETSMTRRLFEGCWRDLTSASGSRRRRPRLACALAGGLLSLTSLVHAQPYDLLLKGGHVIDSVNGIDGPMDVAVKEEKIAAVARELPASDADKVVDVAGYYVTPGLIDIHTHIFVGNRPGAFADGFSSVSPDDFSFRSGVTTVVDAGTSGWRNFPLFKEQVIDQSNTRVLAFLNIVGYGMWSDDRNQDLEDMDAALTSAMMNAHPDIIVGTKVGHFGAAAWDPVDRALDAAGAAGSPMLLECHLPELELSKLLDRLRPGDIFTHAFGAVNDRESVVGDDGRVRDYVRHARDRGILFDVGHGGGSFHFSQALPALEQGLVPNTFSTDLHRGSMNAGMKDLLNIMSKYLNMGLSLKEVIEGATASAAKAIQRDDLGQLGAGTIADIAVLALEKGNFGFVDAGGYRLNGDRKLTAELTVRRGRIVWDLNGLAAAEWTD